MDQSDIVMEGTSSARVGGQEEPQDVLVEQTSEEEDDTEYEEEDTTSGEEEEGESRNIALAIDPSQLSEDCDNIAPRNGHDYLYFVQSERKKLPSVSFIRREDLPNLSGVKTGFAVCNLVGEDHKMETIEAALDSYHEDDLNQDVILENFKSLKDRVEKARSLIATLEPHRKETYQCDGRSNDRLVQEQSTQAEATATSLLRLMALGQPPRLSDLVKLTQLELHTTLAGIANQLERSKHLCPTLHADWIYSLMAMLVEPIDADTCFDLRRIAKYCINRRQELNSSETVALEDYHSSYLLILIVRRHFGQKDLRPH